jgi:hypothetical protein
MGWTSGTTFRAGGGATCHSHALGDYSSRHRSAELDAALADFEAREERELERGLTDAARNDPRLALALLRYRLEKADREARRAALRAAHDDTDREMEERASREVFRSMSPAEYARLERAHRRLERGEQLTTDDLVAHGEWYVRLCRVVAAMRKGGGRVV